MQQVKNREKKINHGLSARKQVIFVEFVCSATSRFSRIFHCIQLLRICHLCWVFTSLRRLELCVSYALNLWVSYIIEKLRTERIGFLRLYPKIKITKQMARIFLLLNFRHLLLVQNKRDFANLLVPSNWSLPYIFISCNKFGLKMKINIFSYSSYRKLFRKNHLQ